MVFTLRVSPFRPGHLSVGLILAAVALGPAGTNGSAGSDPEVDGAFKTAI